MPLPSSGAISLSQVNVELGRSASAAVSLNESAVRTLFGKGSGTISMSDGYGKANRVTANITISANTSNYVLNTAKVAGYSAGRTDVVLTINSGVYVSSNSTGVFALDVDTSWAAGDTVRINNNGFIIGMGGAGGLGGPNTIGYGTGSAGAGGGPALRAQRAVSVSNAGTIGGGGGGGGGGRGATNRFTDGKGGTNDTYAAGGGGGGGRSSAAANSAAGGGGTGTTFAGGQPGSPGGVGTVSGAGGGGAGGSTIYGNGGAGGSGGGWGASGAAGGNSTTANGATIAQSWGPYSGGAGGSAVSGNANITWLATGTRLGGIA